MNYFLRKVLEYVAGNENIEAISLDKLQKLADESPYFPVAQFFLAKKLKAENDPGFLSQVQKTALYFSNPYWLHYQLTNESGQDSLLENNYFVDKVPSNNKSIISELSADEVGQK